MLRLMAACCQEAASGNEMLLNREKYVRRVYFNQCNNCRWNGIFSIEIRRDSVKIAYSLQFNIAIKEN